MSADSDKGGAIVEFIPLGGSVKVTAIDPETGTEVSIVGAASAGERELAALAVRKLRFVLQKKSPPDEESGGPGVLV